MNFRNFKNISIQFSRYDNGNICGELYDGNVLLTCFTEEGFIMDIEQDLKSRCLFLKHGEKYEGILSLLLENNVILARIPKKFKGENVCHNLCITNEDVCIADYRMAACY